MSKKLERADGRASMSSYHSSETVDSTVPVVMKPWSAPRFPYQFSILAALPSIFAGLRIALPLAITVVVVTEMIGDSIGLGYYISIWGTRFRFANVYAGILMIGICGLVLDWMLTFLRNRLVKGNS